MHSVKDMGAELEALWAMLERRGRSSSGLFSSEKVADYSSSSSEAESS